jgi:hypothetical protein
MPATLAPITKDESKRLIALESVIKAGLSNFIEVGNALLEIRDGKLYKSEYSTFDAYCVKRWGMQRHYANRLIGAAETAADLVPTGTIPQSERQTRPLTKLETPEQQQEAWSAAVEASGGQPTAKQVEAAVDEILEREEPEAAPEKLPKYQPSNGLMYADNAISQLAKIQPNDTQRSRAKTRVLKWIEENL